MGVEPELKILLIEDNRTIAETIFDYFELKGLSLDFAADGAQGIQLATANQYDVIILDIMLPKMDGFSVCNSLRNSGVDTPVLMLTAKDRREDILNGFSQGADDYLVKPFDLDILEARLHALVRRNRRENGGKNLQFSGLSLDLETRILTRERKEFSLNPTQFSLMKALLRQAPDVVLRQALIEEVWGEEQPDNDLLRGHIYQLRCLIDKPYQHEYICTVPKTGYRLAPPDEQKN